MDLFDLQKKIRINNNLRALAKNVQQKRIKEGKTVEDISYDALGLNSTSFYSSAENLTHGKHFNVEHLFRLAEYYGCDVREFFPDGGSNDASIE